MFKHHWEVERTFTEAGYGDHLPPRIAGEWEPFGVSGNYVYWRRRRSGTAAHSKFATILPGTPRKIARAFDRLPDHVKNS
jgi:hypothetical protein